MRFLEFGCGAKKCRMQFEKAYSFLLRKLRDELPSWLTYHNLQHTKNVVEAVKFLSKAEDIRSKDVTLLKTAAAFHDAGFIKGYENHEELSCEIAKELLPRFNYNEKEIEKICQLIMVTKTPQVPHNHLEQILCDADLLYLGTDQYDEIAEKLFGELMHKGEIKNRLAWEERQTHFLSNHRFFTQTAINKYSKKKEQHLKRLTNTANKERIQPL